MFSLYANKSMLTRQQKEPLTSGSVNTYEVRFMFSPDWDGLTKVAVFKAGSESKSVLLDDTGQCVIPWEVLETPQLRLVAGVYGKRGGEIILPTIWCGLGTIQEGVPAPDGQTPTPELWEQLLAGKQDRLHGLPGQMTGYNEAGEAEAQDLPGGGATGEIVFASDEEVEAMLDSIFGKQPSA